MKSVDFQNHAEKVFPVVSHLGLRVKDLSPQVSVLSGEWAPNKNHLETVFGGSLYSFSALACYGLIWSFLDHHQVNSQDIVISEGKIQYLSPVKGDFEVTCKASPDLQKFLQALQKKSKARVTLAAEILYQQQVCARFEGQYVVVNN